MARNDNFPTTEQMHIPLRLAQSLGSSSLKMLISVDSTTKNESDRNTKPREKTGAFS